MGKAETEETFDAEFKRILPPDEGSIFSYKLDVANGHWVLWTDSLPKIPESFEVNCSVHFGILMESAKN